MGMGNRCFFQLTVVKEDVGKINGVIWDGDPDCWGEVTDNEDGTVTLIDCAADFGHFAQLAQLAKAGIVFKGFRYAGDGIDGADFVSYDGNYAEVTTAAEGGHVVLVGRGGADKMGLERVEEYYVMYDSVEKYFKENCAKGKN